MWLLIWLLMLLCLCFLKLRFWSNVTPRNLACLVVGMFLLCSCNGGDVSLVYCRTCPKISSHVFFSFKLILEFPQKEAIRFMEICSFLCRIVRSYDDENVLMSSANCVIYVFFCWLGDVGYIYYEKDRAKCGALRDSMVNFDEWGALLVNFEVCVSVG